MCIRDSRRTVYYALEHLCRLQHPLIEKLQHGVYRKLITENTDAPCTIALSASQDTVQSSQSAKVQSATTVSYTHLDLYKRQTWNVQITRVEL